MYRKRTAKKDRAAFRANWMLSSFKVGATYRDITKVQRGEVVREFTAWDDRGWGRRPGRFGILRYMESAPPSPVTVFRPRRWISLLPRDLRPEAAFHPAVKVR